MSEPQDPGVERLTARQLECLRFRCMGMTGTQIARRLSISPFTVKNHLTEVYKQLPVAATAGNPECAACFWLGMSEATRILPDPGTMRPHEV